jgi:hypothetical protein
MSSTPKSPVLPPQLFKLIPKADTGSSLPDVIRSDRNPLSPAKL